MLAVLFLGERLQRSTLWCIALSILGLLALCYPNLHQATSTASYGLYALGVIGACGTSIAYILVKKLSKDEDSSVIVFYFPLVALPISMVLLGADFVIPDMASCTLLVLVGLFTQVGQVGLTNAMRSESASKATAYSYVQIVFAIALGWAFFEELPSAWTYLAAMLILLGAVINTYGRLKQP